MKFTKEMMEKAKAAGTAEELAEMAKTAGIDLDADEAEKVFSDLHKSGELADEELDNVAGGGCTDPREGCYSSREEVKFKYEVGAKVWATEGEMSSSGTIVSRDIKSQKGRGFNFGYEYYPVYLVGIGIKGIGGYHEKEFREENVKLY